MGSRADLDGCGGEKGWLEVRMKFLGVRIFFTLFWKCIVLCTNTEYGLTGKDKCSDQTLFQYYGSLITALKLNADLCNEKMATYARAPSLLFMYEVHQFRTTFECTWSMGRVYYFTVLNLWLVFRAHGSSALSSVTINHCETWQWKCVKTAESRFSHVRQFIPPENF